jgi:hypothetical protein
MSAHAGWLAPGSSSAAPLVSRPSARACLREEAPVSTLTARHLTLQALRAVNARLRASCILLELCLVAARATVRVERGGVESGAWGVAGVLWL